VRATIGYAVKHPEFIPDWWADLPKRRRHYWHTLLREPGLGWLCWRFDERTEYVDIGCDFMMPESYPVAPPLRRLFVGAKYLATQLRHPIFFAREGGFEWPWTYSSFLRDPDRKRDMNR